MKVKVEFYSFFRLIAKCKEIQLELDADSCTFRDILEELNKRLHEDFINKISSKIENKDLQSLIFINGVNLAQQEGLQTRVLDNSNVQFLPPMGGG